MLALTCWLSCQHKTVKPGRSSKRNCLFELGSTLQPEQKPARLWLRNQTGFAFVWNLSQHLPVDSNSFSKPSSKCCQLCVVAEFANFVLAQASLKKFGAKRITVSSLSSGVWWSAHCIPVSSGPDTIPGNRQAMHGQEKIATWCEKMCPNQAIGTSWSFSLRLALKSCALPAWNVDLSLDVWLDQDKFQTIHLDRNITDQLIQSSYEASNSRSLRTQGAFMR